MAESDYKERLLQQLAQIPKGKVCSYGQLATLAGLPGYARQVGNLLKELPKDTQLPWHRVVNSQGKISFPEGSEAYNEQKKRLENDGLVVLKGKISKSQFI